MEIIKVYYCVYESVYECIWNFYLLLWVTKWTLIGGSLKTFTKKKTHRESSSNCTKVVRVYSERMDKNKKGTQGKEQDTWRWVRVHCALCGRDIYTTTNDDVHFQWQTNGAFADWSGMMGPYSHLEVNTVLVMRIILKRRPLWTGFYVPVFYYNPNIFIYCIYVSYLHIIADGGRFFSQKCQWVRGVDSLGLKCSQLWEFKLT